MNDDSSVAAIVATLAHEVEAQAPGTKLPSHRSLVARFHASATTVAAALTVLAQRGLVESRPGAGTFRSQQRATAAAGDTSWQTKALLRPPDGTWRELDATALINTLELPKPDVIDLNGGYLHPELQPLPALSKALARAARSTQAWHRPPVAGIPELRDWFAADIGGGLSQQDIIVCGGGQSALAIVMRAVAHPGQSIIVESPTYPGTISAAQAAGLRIVPVPIDDEGLDPEALELALRRTDARLIATQPLFQNPTGVSISRARQQQIREIARRAGAFVLEDDFVRHLAHSDSGPLTPPMICDDPHGSVVHIRSLTKVASPNLRVAAIAARGPVWARLRAASIIETMFVPAPLQLTALEVVTAPAWKRGLSALQRELTHRRETAVGAVAEVFGTGAVARVQRGGYHLWVRLPQHLDSVQFASAAMAVGSAVTPGRNYLPSDDGEPHLRLSYVAAPSAAEVGQGIARLEPLLGE